MDVTCERCGTEYEFDETLVSDRGTTVKCTNCGHLFKVFRRSGEPSRADESTKIWQLRTASGETQSFGSLKDLQRLIAEGKVSEDDKLARTGEGWKRLGDIAELATFFQAARVAKPKPNAPAGPPASPPAGPPPGPPGRQQGGKGTMMGMGQTQAIPAVQPPRKPSAPQPTATTRGAAPPSVPAPPPPAPPPPPQAAPARPTPRTDQTMKGVGSGARQSYEEIGSSEAISEPAIAAPRAPAPPAPSRDVDSDPPPPRPRERRPEERRPEERRPDSRRPPSVRPLQLDDDAPTPPLPRRNLTPVFLGLVVLALVGGGLYWAWPQLQGGGETTTEVSPADRFITAGEEALAHDRLETYDDAADEFTKALGQDEDSVRAQIGLARAHALQAQARLFEADDLDARAADDPALHGEATVLRRTAAEEAAEARTAAEAAVRNGTGGADAELVLADALRLVGERDLAQSRLARARTMAPTASAESLRVEALLTAQAAGPQGLTAARDLAAQAVAADGDLLRARLLLARASLAAGDGEAARREAEAVLAHDGTHAEALSLRDRAMPMIAAGGGTPVPPTTTTAPPTTTTTAPPTTTTALPTTTTAPPTTTTSGGGSESGGGGGTAPQARDYSALVREGEGRLERGQIAGARQSFEAALRSRSGGAEAMTGLGYVMLNEGNAQGAVRQFQTAAGNGNGDALIGLGDAYRRLGQRDQALEAYRRYIQILPSGSHASMARRQIETLGGTTGGGSTGGSGGGSHETGGSGSQETGGGGGGEETGGGGGSDPTPPPPTTSDTPAIESEP